MRRTPVVPLPDQGTLDGQRMAAALERALGFVVPVLTVDVVRDEAGLTVASASSPGTAVVSSRHRIDWLDSGADEWRLTGYGRDATSASLVLRYVVNGIVLASVTLPQGAADDFTGAWSRITPAQKQTVADDQVGYVTVVGAGANALLYGVQVQARTVSRVV